jgi:hypothetical protein
MEEDAMNISSARRLTLPRSSRSAGRSTNRLEADELARHALTPKGSAEVAEPAEAKESLGAASAEALLKFAEERWLT